MTPFRIASLLAVVPVWVAAIRAGVQNTPQIGDAAITVLRARDVFSTNPPLVGMVAAGASGGAHEVYFPGPWQLYVLAGPTQLFGSVWGPVLAMAALNTVWILLACRLLRRRLDRSGALLGIGFLVVFLWSIGSGMLITPVPMDMVTIPFVTFLVAVWATASGDIDALPTLAFVANFLWLSHLVLIMLVPVVGLCGIIGLILVRRGARRGGTEQRPARRPLLGAAVITVILWIPPVIDQIRANPGNLGQLFASSGEARETVGSWATAFHVVIEIIARPWFWFRGTLHEPSYAGPPIGPEVIGELTVFDLVAGVLVLGILATLLVLAHRRRDRTGMWALIVAVVAALASVPNVFLAPTALGIFPFVYLRSLHGVAMFVWFAVALNIWRVVRGRVSARAPTAAAVRWGLVGLIGVVTVLNLPTGDKGHGTDAREAKLVRQMNTAVTDALAGTGPVHLRSGWDLSSQIYFGSLALGLADAGIPFCIPGQMGPQLGRSCTDNVARTVTVMSDDDGRTNRDNALWSGHNLNRAERDRLDHLNQRWDEWLADQDRLQLTDEAAELMEQDLSPDQIELFEMLAAPDDGDLAGVQHTFPVQSLVGAMILAHGGRGVSPFVDSPLQGPELVQWHDLATEDVTVFVLDGVPD